MKAHSSLDIEARPALTMSDPSLLKMRPRWLVAMFSKVDLTPEPRNRPDSAVILDCTASLQRTLPQHFALEEMRDGLCYWTGPCCRSARRTSRRS